MPPPRPSRRRCRPRRRSSTAAETTHCSRGWLSVRRRPFKREPEPGDQALPLCDETLLLVFSGLSDARDLVRCAATCKRWRRLVSSDAAFICRRGPPRCDRFVSRLALGVFLRGSKGHGGFVPFVPAPLSVAAIVDGGTLGASRVVASRNGRVVLDLRRAKTSCVLRLCVCDPMTGDADFLPPLRGKDRPGPYACALLTADDGLHLYEGSTPAKRCSSTATSPSSYRVLLLFNHRSYSALRCYSSDDAGSWGPEVRVTGSRIRRGRQLAEKAAHATLVRGGVVCWQGLGIGLELATLQTSTPPYTVKGFDSPSRAGNTVSSGGAVDHRLLGVMPDGRVCVLERRADDTVRAYVISGVSGRKVLMWTLKAAPMGLRAVRLRWFCEKSGVVLFTATRKDEGGAGRAQVYKLDMESNQVAMVDWPGDQNGEVMDVCGFEMDRVAMLAELDRSTELHLPRSAAGRSDSSFISSTR